MECYETLLAERNPECDHFIDDWYAECCGDDIDDCFSIQIEKHVMKLPNPKIDKVKIWHEVNVDMAIEYALDKGYGKLLDEEAHQLALVFENYQRDDWEVVFDDKFEEVTGRSLECDDEEE